MQPQDRRSPRAGDRDEAVEARRRWLGRGFAAGLATRLSSRVAAASPPAGAWSLDVGCGEGSLTAALFGSRPEGCCGIDLSTKAIRLAARLQPGLTWIVANADRGLPFADASVGLAVSIFGRRPAAELRRVLAPTGRLIIVVPASDDLIELRHASAGAGIPRERVDDVLTELGAGFTLASRDTWRERASHDRAALLDALAMSYRGVRASERARLDGVDARDVTLAADILELVPRVGLR